MLVLQLLTVCMGAIGDGVHLHELILQPPTMWSLTDDALCADAIVAGFIVGDL